MLRWQDWAAEEGLLMGDRLTFSSVIWSWDCPMAKGTEFLKSSWTRRERKRGSQN
jgi:hypothetical protein